MTTRWFSLRRRLLVMLLGGLSACWAGMLVFTWQDAHHEIDALFDAQLAQTAQALLVLAGREDVRGIEDAGEAAHRYQRRLRFQIRRADGHLVLRSPNAPEHPLTAVEGFSETNDEDGHWRHFSHWNRDRSLQVQVSENHHGRDEVIGHIVGRLLVPALVGLPLLGLWIWLATRRSLATLDGVAAEIRDQAPRHMRPVEPPQAPQEIRPLLEALNGLFRRVEEALDMERRFTADAAHELRTPLAALQAQAQVALRARDAGEREHSLGNLQAGLGRASHLVEQMLLLARLDPERGLPEAASVDLGALAEEVCAELGSLVLAKGQEFELAAEASVRVRGQEDWLAVLIRNLVDNASRYTPAGGHVRVEIRQRDGQACLRVADSGPGIPAVQRQEVLRRFRRLPGSKETGSGLGLSIAQRIAELHGGSLGLGESEAGGLLAEVCFPVSP